jgi:CcmD family protein
MTHRTFLRTALVMMLHGIIAVGVAAQQSPFPQTQLGQQNLRPYWHVFIAYAVVIVLIGGWALSIARRLRSVEDRLVD